MYSYRDPVTNVLMSWGYASSNCRIGQIPPNCDIQREEPEDFNLTPGEWQWDGEKWIPYP